jgi:hypothetical protein
MPNPSIINVDIRPEIIKDAVVKAGFTVAQDAGGVIPRFAVMGVINANGHLKRAAAASTDGSQFAKYVTLEPIDATAGTVTGVRVLRLGSIRSDALKFTGSETLATTSNIAVGADAGTAATILTFEQQLQINGIIAREGTELGDLDNQ